MQHQLVLAISNVDLLLLCYQRHVQEDPWYIYSLVIWLCEVFSAMRRFPNRGSTEKPLPGATLTHRGRNGFDRFLHGRCFILGYVSGIHPLLEISSVSWGKYVQWCSIADSHSKKLNIHYYIYILYNHNLKSINNLIFPSPFILVTPPSWFQSYVDFWTLPGRKHQAKQQSKRKAKIAPMRRGWISDINA